MPHMFIILWKGSASILGKGAKKADTAREMWELKSSLDWLRSLSFSLFPMASKDWQVFQRHIHWKVIYEMDYRWTTDYVFFKHDSIFRTLTVGTSGHCQLVKNILIFFIRRVILSSRPLLWLVRFKESHCLVRVSNSSFSCKQQALGRK